MYSQLSSAQLQLSSAAQWVSCGALPCGAVLRRATPCCAVLSFVQIVKILCQVLGAMYRYVRVYSYFLSLDWLSFLVHLSSCPAPPPVNSTRTANQNVTSPARTQHITGHRAINSPPNHGPLTSAPFTSSYILPCARAASGVSRRRDGDLKVLTMPTVGLELPRRKSETFV